MGRMLHILIAVALLASCASQPEVGNPVVTREGTVQVIDDIHRLTRATPDWIFLEPAEIEKTSAYEGRYVFKGVSTGRDLVGLQQWVTGFIESADLAKFVGVRVRDALAGAAAGDIDTLATYLANVVNAVSESRYSDARIVMRYWWQIRTAQAESGIGNVYEYYVLYTIDRPQIDAAIMRAFQENEPNVQAGTEDEQAAWDRVKRVMESEGL